MRLQRRPDADEPANLPRDGSKAPWAAMTPLWECYQDDRSRPRLAPWEGAKIPGGPPLQPGCDDPRRPGSYGQATGRRAEAAFDLPPWNDFQAAPAIPAAAPPGLVWRGCEGAPGTAPQAAAHPSGAGSEAARDAPGQPGESLRVPDAGGGAATEQRSSKQGQGNKICKPAQPPAPQPRQPNLPMPMQLIQGPASLSEPPPAEAPPVLPAPPGPAVGPEVLLSASQQPSAPLPPQQRQSPGEHWVEEQPIKASWQPPLRQCWPPQEHEAEEQPAEAPPSMPWQLPANSQRQEQQPVSEQPEAVPAHASAGLRVKRGQLLEQIPEGMHPLEAQRSGILDWIQSHGICFIEAATGMGKSTRIPQFVMDADAGNIVWQLQPRRLAAKRLAEYMASSRPDGGGLGDEIGYCVRGDKQCSDMTRLLYMTTGYFLHFVLHHLRRLDAQTERPGGEPSEGFKWCTHLFIDEVHEASEETELVLLLVKMLRYRCKLAYKVVVLSATLDFDMLHNYFVQIPDTSPPPANANGQGGPAAAESAPPPPPPPPQQLKPQEAEEVDSADDEKEPEGPQAVLCEQDALELHLTDAERLPVGLSFQPEGESEQVRWMVAGVQEPSFAWGRVQIGDELVKVNGEPVASLAYEELMASMTLRPLWLSFLHTSNAPLKVAECVLDLVQRTPFEVTIKYLDDLAETMGEVAEVPLRSFNPERLRRQGLDKLLLELCVTLLLQECRLPEDCALVFLPGISEIEHFHKVLEQRMRETNHSPRLDVVVLHSITLAENCEVPGPSHNPVAYLASSVAETSITLPELTSVFDFGLARVAVFDPILEMEQLTTRVASRTSCRQRAGRVGRTKPGRVYRLYPKSTFEQMPARESWGGNDGKRCLESTMLLVTKTLVPFLDLDVRSCLRLLIQPPPEAAVTETLLRLEELDALEPSSNGRPQLTAFGEFAVCIAVLGPRLARLVYCGALYNCVRLAITLAAVHVVCGRGEMFNLPSDIRKAATREEDPPPPLPSKEERLTVTMDGDGPLGIVFPSAGRRLGRCQGWSVKSVKDGSWAQEHGIRGGDELVAINSSCLAEMDEGAVVEELGKRPLELHFARVTEPEKDAATENCPVWSSATLGQVIAIAKCCVRLDAGNMSEPVACLRLVDCYLDWQLEPGLCPLHRLRQIDGIIREVSAKLRALCQTMTRRSSSTWRMVPWQEKHVLQGLKKDELFFWDFDYERPLSITSSRQFGANYLSDCLHVSNVWLLLCSAFEGNFLMSSLKQKPKEAAPPRAAAAPPPPQGVPALADGDEFQPEFAAEEQLPLPSADLEETVEPALTLSNAPPDLQPEEIAERIRGTFNWQHVAVEVERVEGKGNFVLRFPPPPLWPAGYGRVDAEDPEHIVSLRQAAILNMVAQRDPRHRLQLCDRLGSGVQACGELAVVPAFEWRLLRFPQLLVRPAPKVTPLAQVGPVPGLGPALPRAGPGASGNRLAVAMELEAVQLHQRQAKSFRGGKAIRSWLVSWLPSTDCLDLALLLVFWPREMSFQECRAHGRLGVTAYSAITVGQGLTVHFPESAPLPAPAFKELREMHLALCYAHRTGTVREEGLPQIAKLRTWGRLHLASATIISERPTISELLEKSPGKAMRYTHRRGFGSVAMSEAPARVLGILGRHGDQLTPRSERGADQAQPQPEATLPPGPPSAGQGNSGADVPPPPPLSEDFPVPPWETECLVELPSAEAGPGWAGGPTPAAESAPSAMPPTLSENFGLGCELPEALQEPPPPPPLPEGPSPTSQPGPLLGPPVCSP